MAKARGTGGCTTEAKLAKRQELEGTLF
jgi:hypothetical protein